MPEDFFVHAYVGGVVEGSNSIAQLLGCMRGIRIGNNIFKLTDATIALDNNTCRFVFITNYICVYVSDLLHEYS